MATIIRHSKFPAGARRALRLGLQALGALALTVLVALASAPVKAQVQAPGRIQNQSQNHAQLEAQSPRGRPIPAAAQLARLKLGVFPEAELDGRRITLGPGVRIFNRDNMLVVPAALKDVSSVVAYTTGSLGEVVTVWILDEAEVKSIRARRKAG